jgi:hypothetical protein
VLSSQIISVKPDRATIVLFHDSRFSYGVVLVRLARTVNVQRYFFSY